MNYTDITYNEANSLQLRERITAGDTVFFHFHGGGLEVGSHECDRNILDALYEAGISSVSINYRHYPNAKYPEFIEDAAEGIAYELNKYKGRFKHIYAGGISAGSYISMMLFFDKRYLGKYGIDPRDFDGWIFDAGQPTVHFNVLRERGFDTRLIRVDEAAPIYYITENFTGKLPKLLSFTTTDDMKCRLEQIKLLHATLDHFKYPSELHSVRVIEGYTHCGYCKEPFYSEMLIDFMKN